MIRNKLACRFCLEMNIKAFISRATAKLKLFEFRNQSKEVKIMLISAKYKVV